MTNTPQTLQLHHLIPLVKDKDWRVTWQGRLSTKQSLLLSHIDNQKDLSVLPYLTGWPISAVMQQLRQLIRWELVELCRKVPSTVLTEETPQPSVAVQKGVRLSSHGSHNPLPVPQLGSTVVVPKIRGGQHTHYQGPTPLPASPGIPRSQSTPHYTAHHPELRSTHSKVQRRPPAHTLEPYTVGHTPTSSLHFVELVSDTQEELPASTQSIPALHQPISLQPGMQEGPFRGNRQPPNRPGHLNFDPTVEEIPSLRRMQREEDYHSLDSLVMEGAPQTSMRSRQHLPHLTQPESPSLSSLHSSREAALTGESPLISKKKRQGVPVRVKRSLKRER